jgi:hypothetical protein
MGASPRTIDGGNMSENQKVEPWPILEQKPINASPTRTDAPMHGMFIALAKAQAEMQNPGFDSTNPHFRSKFASLASVRNAVIPVFAKHGIALMQDVQTVDGGISCTTILTHASGQQMHFGPLVLPASKSDAQGFGSAATYARRYAMMAVAGVVGDDDDDANAATGKAGNQAYEKPHTPIPDSVKNVDSELAQAAAKRMAFLLDEDVSEEKKAMNVADEHDKIKSNHDLYIAASQLLPASKRNAWKAYVKLAAEAERAELAKRTF